MIVKCRIRRHRRLLAAAILCFVSFFYFGFFVHCFKSLLDSGVSCRNDADGECRVDDDDF